MTFYNGKHIVMREVIGNTIIEKYIVVEDGIVYLETYRNFVLYDEILIAILR